MAIDLTQLYKTQISLTEWFEGIEHAQTEAMRHEDNVKRDRLAVLNEIIGLPYDKPHQFPAADLVDRPDEFKKFLNEHGNELCALRLVPMDPKLPKLRMRGHTVKDVLETWFPEQKIETSKYKADFVPHSEKNIYATTFIVKEKGIIGEAVEGSLSQLSQGFYEKDAPIIFRFDFKNWVLSRRDKKLEEHLKDVISRLLVSDSEKQKMLSERLDAKFSNGYLQGYFETVLSEQGLWFVDYNRLLGDLFGDIKLPEQPDAKAALSGMSGFAGSPGIARGMVKIIHSVEDTDQFNEGDILVCQMTTPAYVPLMKKAAGIITDQGGILSHAAIVSRELKVPSVVGTKTATTVLRDGEMVEVNGNEGKVLKI